MSWTKDMSSHHENAVIFEIVSTWRRNHTWPCTAAFTGPDRRCDILQLCDFAANEILHLSSIFVLKVHRIVV